MFGLVEYYFAIDFVGNNPQIALCCHVGYRDQLLPGQNPPGRIPGGIDEDRFCARRYSGSKAIGIDYESSVYRGHGDANRCRAGE